MTCSSSCFFHQQQPLSPRHGAEVLSKSGHILMPRRDIDMAVRVLSLTSRYRPKISRRVCSLDEKCACGCPGKKERAGNLSRTRSSAVAKVHLSFWVTQLSLDLYFHFAFCPQARQDVDTSALTDVRLISPTAPIICKSFSSYRQQQGHNL